MAEEKKNASSAVKVGIKFLIGVVLVALGVAAVIKFWGDCLVVVKACVGLFLLLAGVITIAIAKE